MIDFIRKLLFKQDSVGCIGYTTRCLSGIYFDFRNPTTDMVTVGDIACGLSKECRFANQIEEHYSVAEHSMIGANYILDRTGDYELARAFLLHDASEAYCRDITKPLKNLIGRSYKRIEDRVQKVIGERFGVDFKRHHPEIKKYDNLMLLAEKRRFHGNKERWTDEEKFDRIDSEIHFMAFEHRDARREFLLMCEEYGVK